jgi:hypothetical protein
MDAEGALDESASRGRQSRVVLTPSRRCQVGGDKPLTTVAKERGSPGRARRKPLKPLRAGMPDVSGEPVVTNSCVYLHFTREAAGMRSHVSQRHCERSEAIQLSSLLRAKQAGLLRRKGSSQ